MLTIGHSTLAIESFARILKDNDVHTLVDIRSIPKSGFNPQFGQDRLALSMESFGIKYRWLPAIGGLRKKQKISVNLAWKNLSFRNYADFMQTEKFHEGIDELLSISDNPVIMCAEAVPWRCHRSMVADALTARGILVENIFYDKNGNSHRKTHALRDFAQVDGLRVWYPGEPRLF